jgi:hypothetical protein
MLMMIIIMPWGAYANVASSSARTTGVTVVSARDNERGAGDESAFKQNYLTKLSAPPNCRTIPLPGFSCAADQAILMASLSCGWPDVKADVKPGADWVRRGRSAPPPRDPPRFF